MSDKRYPAVMAKGYKMAPHRNPEEFRKVAERLRDAEDNLYDADASAKSSRAVGHRDEKGYRGSEALNSATEAKSKKASRARHEEYDIIKERYNDIRHGRGKHAKALVSDLIGAGIAGGNKRHSAKYVRMLLED